MAKKPNSYEEFPLDKLQLYAGIDALVTSRLRNKLLPMLKKEITYETSAGAVNMGNLYQRDIQQVKGRALDFLLELEYNGIGFDLEYYYGLQSKVELRVKEYSETLGDLGFSLSSGPQLMEYVYGTRGFAPVNYTAKGQPSVDYDTLTSYDDPVLTTIAKHNELQSMYSTFLRAYHLNVKRDGRIHPRYNLHGTSSHRITGTDPNLTQLPRDRDGISFRTCFVPGPGNVFVAADYSSAEVKLLAAISRDPNLLLAAREGRDFHSSTAALLKGIPYEEFLDMRKTGTPEQRAECDLLRQSAKSITFAILYGSSEYSVARKLGVSKEKAHELFSLYFQNYPGIEAYVNEAHYVSKANKMIMTKLGQIRREYGLQEWFGESKGLKSEAVYNYSLRNSQNVIIQSVTSTLGLMAFSELSDRLRAISGKAVCTVYDSIEMEVPQEKLEDCIKLVKYCLEDWPMETFDWLDFPIQVDIEAGPNWGNCHKIAA
jgi:DNA polymerase-1